MPINNKMENEKKYMELPPAGYIIMALLCGLVIGSITSMADMKNPITLMIFSSSIGAMGSFFLEFTFRPGNIFGWYMDFLDKYFRDNKKNPLFFLYSPLGGCIYCMNIWLSSGIFILMDWINDVSYWLFIPSLFFSHLILSFLDKIFWRA